MQGFDKRVGAVLLLGALCAAGHATEGTSLRALNGAPASEVTAPQFPGWYGQVWLNHYRADKLRDEAGRAPAMRTEDTLVGPLDVERQARIRATVVVARATWLSEIRLGEGKFGVSLTVPFAEVDQQIRLRARFPSSLSTGVQGLVNERLNLISSRVSGKRHGLGDTEVMPYVDWQTDTYRYAIGLGVVAPTGDYDADREFNTGAGNFWTLRPMLLGAYSFENGVALGVRATYSINGENRDTGNRSGQYLAADASANYTVNDAWRVGLQGYVNLQTTADRCADPVASRCGKARMFALGPVVSFTSEDGRLFVDAKVLREFNGRNRPEGTAFWLRANFRVGE